MKKILIYYNFILISSMTVMGFVQATTIPQLVSAVLFFPLAVYFARLVIPTRSRALILPQPVKKVKKIHVKPAPVPVKLLKPDALDSNKRMFLKLIGSAGISLLFFSLFTKKAHAAFFGSVPGPGTVSIKDTTGAQIDPAIKHPTDGYRINQVDDTTSDTYSYYGFVNKDGAWFIMRETTLGVDVGQYRYTRGTSGFSAGWDDKIDPDIPYNYFDEIFD